MKVITQIIFFLAVIFSVCTCAEAAGEKILFIPVDERPVTFKQTVEVLEQAGCEMITPPAEYLRRDDGGKSLEKLLAWLEENSPSVDAAVISADAILYGGLIPSRKHYFDAEVLNSRIEKIVQLHEKNPKLKIYVLSSVMRAPHEGTVGSVEEPEYYANYGARIFKYTSLLVKEKFSGLMSGERAELERLRGIIPVAFIDDWLARRRKNLDATEKLIDLANEGVINYLIVGRDDHWTYSQTQSESIELSNYAQATGTKNFQLISGIDEFGLLLLARAVNELRGNHPKVFVEYNKGVGAEIVPAYSDETVAVAIESELKIAGGSVVDNPATADFILLVNTDPEGKTYHSHNAFPSTRENLDYDAYTPRDGTEFFANLVESYVNKNFDVAVADITFANGADNPMMNLLRERNLLFKLHAYAGWNTPNNSLGFAIGTGILAKNISRDAKDKLLLTRYLDDWAYQANVRTTVGDWIFYNVPGGEQFYSNFGGKNAEIESRITALMNEFADKNLRPYKKFPPFVVNSTWNRMFEVDIVFLE